MMKPNKAIEAKYKNVKETYINQRHCLNLSDKDKQVLDEAFKNDVFDPKGVNAAIWKRLDNAILVLNSKKKDTISTEKPKRLLKNRKNLLSAYVSRMAN